MTMKITIHRRTAFARIIIDMVVPLTPTYLGNKVILSVICEMTRYVILIPNKH
jgi:hypothetical protein